MLLNLPEDAWRSIALHLSPPDILSFLSVHRNINNHLAKNSASFWNQLTACHRAEITTNNSVPHKATSSTTYGVHSSSSVQDAKHEFMLQSYKSHLPSVQWIPLNIHRTFPIDAREGHISCVLNHTTATNANTKYLVITGGFSDDESITIVSIPRGIQSYNKTWDWNTVTPAGECRCSFVYGATLTPLPSSSSLENVARAIRFGGFKGGGYSDETNEVWVLTIRTEEHHDNDDNDGRISQSANWEKIETNGTLPRPRAYHTATLIHDRYLVVIGGMTWQGSTIDGAILDITTWTWIDISLACKGEPTGRHGHSVVWDGRRDRLVLFGGGSGTDLLRSGVDNNEVWQLKMNGIEIPSMDLGHGTTSSKMWEWSKIHGDDTSEDEDDSSYDSDEDGEDDADEDDEDEGDEDMNVTDESIANNMNNDATTNNNHLSPTESLCLGRCHNGLKVAPDTVLLMFGGGRTNTNGVLGYDLRTDTFLRPNVTGPLPMPRFTGIASFLDTEGYVFVHGGYNSNQSAGCIKDINLLDLAPFLKRPFTSLPVDTNRRSNMAVESDGGDHMEDGVGERGGGNVLLGRYLMQNLLGLMGTEELEELMSRGGGRR